MDDREKLLEYLNMHNIDTSKVDEFLDSDLDDCGPLSSIHNLLGVVNLAELVDWYQEYLVATAPITYADCGLW